MPTFRSITVFALNVVIHEENERDYKKLFQELLKLKHVVSFNKTHSALIVGLSKIRQGAKKFITGSMIKYINIKPPYFDINKFEILYDEEGNPIQLLPPNIKGTANTVHFALDLSTHRVYVDNRFITPRMARLFFSEIFEQPEIVKNFGLVDVSVHSESKSAEIISKIKTLKKIDVRVMRPNPIGVNRYDEIVLGKLREQNADNLSIAISSKGEFLDPNQEFKMYMHAATSHGRIVATFLDEEEKRKEISTDEMPVTHKESIPKNEPYLNALCRSAIALWGKIREDGNKEI